MTTEGSIDDWRPRVNRALTMAEEAANASGVTKSGIDDQPQPISEAVTPPRHKQHDDNDPPDSTEASRLHPDTELQRLGAEAADLVGSRSEVMEAVAALKAEAEALATPEITPGGGARHESFT